MTRVEMMNVLKELANNSALENKAELMEFCDKQIVSFSKKSTSKADKEKAELNQRIAEMIAEVLADNGRMTVGNIMKEVNIRMGGADYSSQRISNIVTQMKNDERVVRTTDKRIIYYELA